VKILLADDHALFRDGLVMILNALFPETDLYQAGTWGEVHSTLKRHPVDLALVDLSMPGSWQGELPKLCQQYPTVKFCVLSATTTPEVIQAAFQLGIKGYITKLADMDEMEAALRKIIAGGIYFPLELWSTQPATPPTNAPSPLTRRQQDIVSLLAQGNRNKQIGFILGISESTVKRHIYDLFQALNVSNRVEAIEISRHKGLIL
jgi:DNA-binding NarL/FixJ family response regulator